MSGTKCSVASPVGVALMGLPDIGCDEGTQTIEFRRQLAPAWNTDGFRARQRPLRSVRRSESPARDWGACSPQSWRKAP